MLSGQFRLDPTFQLREKKDVNKNYKLPEEEEKSAITEQGLYIVTKTKGSNP
jgi:hypothetical protein